MKSPEEEKWRWMAFLASSMAVLYTDRSLVTYKVPVEYKDSVCFLLVPTDT